MGRVAGRVGNPEPSPNPNPDPTPTPNQVNGYEVVPERLGALLADVAQGELAALAAEATKVAKWQLTLTPSLILTLTLTLTRLPSGGRRARHLGRGRQRRQSRWRRRRRRGGWRARPPRHRVGVGSSPSCPPR